MDDGDTEGDDELSRVLEAIGPRVRALRRARGLTLAALAGSTGLTVSTLSRLETGHRQPTLDLLIPLAREFRVALDQLVDAPASGDPRVHLEPHRHTSGGVIVPLTRHPGRVQVFKHVLGPREPRLRSHDGHAWLYMLAGRLRLILGEEEHLLETGETAEFDPRVPHWFGPDGDSVVEILHLFGPHGDRPVPRVDQLNRADPPGRTGRTGRTGRAGQ